MDDHRLVTLTIAGHSQIPTDQVPAVEALFADFVATLKAHGLDDLRAVLEIAKARAGVTVDLP